MTARLVSIGTAVPPTRVRQEVVRDLFARQPGIDRRAQRLIHAAFDAAAIDGRNTVLVELAGGTPGPFVSAGGRLREPTTAERNAVYTALAPELHAAAAREALAEADVVPAAVTHVITVSCTGFMAPGPDYRLVRDLGLSPATQRYHLGFIGCAAAVPALRLAAHITTGQPDAVVLVVCSELCSLHIRSSADPQQIVAASVFGDGVAAAVITGDPGTRGGFDLERFGTALTTDGEDDMVWTIGDRGFEMTLSPEVPRIVGREVRGAVEAFLGDDRPDAWAVHPGGRSVLDRVAAGLELPETALDASRAVLRDHGNMSSATILFILRALLHDPRPAEGSTVAAVAFGPGLTVESALLTRRGTGDQPDRDGRGAQSGRGTV